MWYSTTYPTSPEPTTYANLPEDLDTWGCGHWRTYYENNKAALGPAQAKEILLIDADRASTFADLHYCKYDCDFVNFFEKEFKESVGNIFSKLYCTGSEVVDTAGTLAAGLHTGIKISTLLIPAAVVVGAVYLFNQVPKK